MAAAAGAGLDVPGLNPADLKLNAQLCRLLEMRFPELTIHPRQDGSGASHIAAVRSEATPAGSSVTSVAFGPVASSAEEPASSASLLPRPHRTLDKLRRAPLSTLTPKEQLGRYANPKSPTAAGSRRCPSAPPPPQPYA
ncbi:hypothetical protein JG688_00013249 [Phytophthora aleatoria]|uniref:Uncharacterized protein n=1 Tax=Phytophthora aleatoria TaxID=2496075 RepID=A0A8J5II14_9STRA|nr:hypothetical protein JG688_00013249 [Phytophthora aleatoria]